MSVIARTGAMLLSGHKKHQWEVGLSLPNLILDRVHPRIAPYKFLVPVIVPKARSNALIELIDWIVKVNAWSRCLLTTKAAEHFSESSALESSLTLPIDIRWRTGGLARS
jgi:hypothetical protein